MRPGFPTSLLRTTQAYSIESQTFFTYAAANGAPVSEARKPAYDRVIRALVYCGVFSTRDGFKLYAAADAAVAKQNLIQNAYHSTEVGSPTFTADAGFVGAAGNSKRLQTGFNPLTASSPKFTRNNNSLGAWKRTHVSNDPGGLAGLYPDTNLLAYNIAGASNGKFFWRAQVGDVTNNIATNTGLFSATRNAASGASAARGGLSGIPLIGNPGASTAFTAGKTIEFCNDGISRDDGTACQIAAGHWGSATTTADERNIYAIVRNYLNEIAGTPDVFKLGFTSTVVEDGVSNIAPGGDRLLDGRVFTAYSKGITGESDQKIVYRTSSDNGKTWSAEADVALPTTGWYYGDCRVRVSPTGKILINVAMQLNGPTFGSSVSHIISGTVAGDLSISFSAPYVLTSTASSPYCSGPIVCLADGRFMLPYYVWYTSDTNKGVRVQFSSDDGATWGNETTVLVNGDGVASGFEYTEACFIQRASGVVRTTDKGYWVVRSNNNGVTWTKDATRIYTEAQALESNIPVLALLPSGRIFMLSRFIGTKDAYETHYTYSDDGGLTWATRTPYYVTGTVSYGLNLQNQGWYDATTGTVIVIVGLGAWANGRIIFQQFEF